MDWKIVLDLLVSILLVATIGYAVMLNQRLGQLRKNRDDLSRIIVNFNEATVRAESSIPKLRKAAEDAGLSLQERVEKAQSLRDDLAFMIERADTMANRLENAVRTARGDARVSAPAAPASAPTSLGAQVPPVQPPAAAGGRSGGIGALGAVNAALQGGGGASPSRAATVAAAAAASEQDMDERSEAERELLRALQSLR